MISTWYLSFFIVILLFITFAAPTAGEDEQNATVTGSSGENATPAENSVKPIPTPVRDTSPSNITLTPEPDANATLSDPALTNLSEETGAAGKQKAFLGWIGIGTNAASVRNYQAASEAFAAALRIENESEEARIGYAAALSELGRDSEAGMILQPVLNKSPYKPELLILFGKELNAVGEYDKAYPVLMNATVQYPEDPEGWNQLAASCAGLSRYEEALSAVRRSLGISVSQSGGWEQLGAILSGQGRFYEAVAAYEKALSIDAKNPGIRTGLGDTWTALSRYAEAEESYKAAAEIRPSDRTIWKRLADTYEKQGDTRKAEEARIKTGTLNQTDNLTVTSG